MHPLIDQKRAEILHICRRHPVRRLEVFGSAARGWDFDPATSDADFLVEFSPESKRGLDAYFALKADLDSCSSARSTWSSRPPCATLICWPMSTAPARLCMQRDPRAWLWDVPGLPQ